MKKYILLLNALFVTLALWAVPARPGGRQVTQPDGSTITIYQHGDEFFHYTTLEDGTWVAKDADGFYRKTEPLTKEQFAQRQARAKRKVASQTQGYPLNLVERGLVILVNFKDVKFQEENTREAYDRMLNGDNYDEYGGIGSAKQYFQDQSRGQYNPQFDVIGPVELPENMAFYGGNDAYGEDKNIPSMILKACGEADTQFGVDFTKYDNNNDNEVDFVFFLYAGYGEHDSPDENTIWPHAFWLYEGYGRRFYVDEKRINTYACTSELSWDTKERAGIGTFCHEFSHVLGLPDLYEVTYTANIKTWGAWSLMDYGSYLNNGTTPPNYSAQERFFLGWLKPTILNKAQTIQLGNIVSNAACIITADGTHNLIGNDPKATTYFLLENRQQTGWDVGLPGHGMLVTRVQYSYKAWFDNAPNSSAIQRVDIIEADGKSGYSRNWANGKPGDAFPTGAQEYKPFTNYPITNITEENGIITFDFMGGGEENVLDGIEDIFPEEEKIIAIYNLLGQPQTTTELSELTQGIYIIRTNKTTKKIAIR